MRTRPTPMTPEEFDLLPRRPGWKHEYFNGMAYIEPRPSVAIVRAPVTARPVSAPDGFTLRPTTAEDAAKLIPAFFESFRETVDYWGYRRDAIRRSSVGSIRSCFAGKRGAFLPASFLAVAPTGRSVAAALLVQGVETANLDLLFVRPRWHRRGLATALVQSAMNALHEAGETFLESGHNVANDPSAAWHRGFGFVELPDLLRARDEARCAAHELHRREQLGDLTDSERAFLADRAAHLRSLADELEAIADRDGWDAVCPLRRHRDREKAANGE